MTKPEITRSQGLHNRITNAELVLESYRTPHRDGWHLLKSLLMVDVLHSTTLIHWKVILYTLPDCVLDTDAYPQVCPRVSRIGPM